MWLFKKKTEEEKDVKQLERELKGIKGGYNEETIKELSNGKGDDE